jgi:hypothetical protein
LSLGEFFKFAMYDKWSAFKQKQKPQKNKKLAAESVILQK